MPAKKKSKTEEADESKKEEASKNEESKKEEESKGEEESKREEEAASSKEDSDEEEESTEDEDRGRGKRKRKSSIETSFEPEDFTMGGKPQVNIIKGRGKKLKDFPSVVASIEKHTTDEVLSAHKFLFGNRGSQLKKKELVDNLLEFSGYLKEVPKGYDEKKRDAEDEIEEVRTSYALRRILVTSARSFLRSQSFRKNTRPRRSK